MSSDIGVYIQLLLTLLIGIIYVQHDFVIRSYKEQTREDTISEQQLKRMSDVIEATKYIVENNLGKVLILTTFDDDELVQRALKNGAKGYLIKCPTRKYQKNYLSVKVLLKITLLPYLQKKIYPIEQHWLCII